MSRNARSLPHEFSAVDFIMDYESGQLDEAAIVEGFQHLKDSGLIYQLQGSYQRMLDDLEDAGLVQ